MTGNRDDALDARRALKDIETAQGRTHAFAFYDGAGPIVVVWGLVWLLANSLAYFKPEAANMAWLVGIVFGAGFSALFGWLSSRKATPGSSLPKALLAGLAIAGVLLIALNGFGMVAGVSSQEQANAVISMAVAFAYILMGFSRGGRMTILGVAVGAATLAGWIWLRDWFELWMGVVGGGGLILGGLWLWRT